MLQTYLFIFSFLSIMFFSGITASAFSSVPRLGPPGNTFSAFQTQLGRQVLPEAFLDTPHPHPAEVTASPVLCSPTSTMPPLYGIIHLSICASQVLGNLRQQPCHSPWCLASGYTRSCSENTLLRQGFIFLELGVWPRDATVSLGEDGGSGRAAGPALRHTVPWKAPGNAC